MGKNAKIVALAACALFVITVFSGCTGNAPQKSGGSGAIPGMNVLLPLSAQAARAKEYDCIMVPDGEKNPLLTLAATPVACQYSQGVAKMKPLLAGGSGKAIEQFTGTMAFSSVLKVEAADGDVSGASMKIASDAWSASRIAVAASSNMSGYEMAMHAALAASYLNAPLILCDSVESAGETLAKLGVEAVICYGVSGNYGKTYSIATVEDAEDFELELVAAASGKISYVALANPLDTGTAKVLSESVTNFSQAQNPKDIHGTSFPLYPGHNLITVDAHYTNGTVEGATEQANRPVLHIWLRDGFEPLDLWHFTNADGSCRFTFWYYNPYLPDGGKTMKPELLLQYECAYTPKTVEGTITVKQIDRTETTFKALSQMAPYLAAARGGVIKTFSNMPAKATSDSNELEYMSVTHNIILDELRAFLNRADGKGLLKQYLAENPYLAIVGGPDFLPFNSDDPARLTDDTFGDVDGDETIDLAVGRPIGASAGSTSALIARTLFYKEYMDKFLPDALPGKETVSAWEDTAYIATGLDSNGALTISTVSNYELLPLFIQSGYTVQTTYNVLSAKEICQEALDFFTTSNMIYWNAHGTPYGYMGFRSFAEYTADYARTLNMGPSCFVTVSCSAGRLDGYEPSESIALAWIDAGCNFYIGGTRVEMAGVMLGGEDYPVEGGASNMASYYVTKYMITNNLPIGTAHRDMKNKWASADSYSTAISTLYGDPAFNPYEPCNEGS